MVLLLLLLLLLASERGSRPHVKEVKGKVLAGGNPPCMGITSGSFV